MGRCGFEPVLSALLSDLRITLLPVVCGRIMVPLSCWLASSEFELFEPGLSEAELCNSRCEGVAGRLVGRFGFEPVLSASLSVIRMFWLPKVLARVILSPALCIGHPRRVPSERSAFEAQLERSPDREFVFRTFAVKDRFLIHRNRRSQKYNSLFHQCLG